MKTLKKITGAVNIISWMLLMINLLITVGMVCVNYSSSGLDMSKYLIMVDSSADSSGMIYRTMIMPDAESLKVVKESSAYKELYVYTTGKSSDVHIGEMQGNKSLKNIKTGEVTSKKDYKLKGMYMYTDKYTDTILWVSMIVSVINWVCGKRARKQLTKTKKFGK